MNEQIKKLDDAKKYILSKIDINAELGVVLGSGLSDLSESLKIKATIPYSEIPHFPKSTVEGHKGNLIVGDYQGKEIILFQGRVHFYEGYSPQEVVFPTRLFKTLGGKALLLTNASGSLNSDWPPGDVMVIEDQINFTGYNPLNGPNLEGFGPRFNDMSEPYNKKLSEILKTCCEKAGLNTHIGTYIGVSGPSMKPQQKSKLLKYLAPPLLA